jgi:hypothetical protein
LFSWSLSGVVVNLGRAKGLQACTPSESGHEMTSKVGTCGGIGSYCLSCGQRGELCLKIAVRKCGRYLNTHRGIVNSAKGKDGRRLAGNHQHGDHCKVPVSIAKLGKADPVGGRKQRESGGNDDFVVS